MRGVGGQGPDFLRQVGPSDDGCRCEYNSLVSQKPIHVEAQRG